MTNSTLQKVAEAIENQLALDENSDVDLAQAAISAFKQSDEWKGVVEALEWYAHGDLGVGDSEVARKALNKLNGGA